MPASDEYTSTTNYSLKKPIDGQAQDAWGLMINEDLDTLDTTLNAMQTDIDSKISASNPTFTGTITAPTDSISGNAIHGGTISNFASTGIDDNASSTALTIDADGATTIDVSSTSDALRITQRNTGNALVVEDSSPDSTPFVVSATGNVGIGTSSPDAKLDVQGSANIDGNVKVNMPSDLWTGGGISTDTLLVGGLHYTPGSWRAGFYSNGYRNSSNTWTSLGVNGYTGAAGIDLDPQGVILFRTEANKATGSSVDVTERMRIDSNGNLKFDSGYGSAATAYGCRAWVNFDGTQVMTVGSSYGPDVPPADYSSPNPIRASGNVSSITDKGTGSYGVNFTTAMPDTNYAITAATIGSTGGGTPFRMVEHTAVGSRSTSSVFFHILSSAGAPVDGIGQVSIFR